MCGSRYFDNFKNIMQSLCNSCGLFYNKHGYQPGSSLEAVAAMCKKEQDSKKVVEKEKDGSSYQDVTDLSDIPGWLSKVYTDLCDR